MADLELTVKQAAEALGVSIRTLRRRLQAGDLSYTRTLRGQQEVTVLDPAEVARYGAAHGYPRERGGAVPSLATSDAEAQPAATAGADQAQQVAALVEQVRALEEERDYLRRVLENVTRALPPAPAEAQGAPPERRRSWWARLWRSEE